MIDGVDLIGLEEYVWWSGQSGGIGRECPGNGNEGHEPGDEDLPKATYALAMTALRAALRALHEVRENA